MTYISEGISSREPGTVSSPLVVVGGGGEPLRQCGAEKLFSFCALAAAAAPTTALEATLRRPPLAGLGGWKQVSGAEQLLSASTGRGKQRRRRQIILMRHMRPESKRTAKTKKPNSCLPFD